MQGRQVRPHQPQHDLVAVLTTYYCYCYYYSLRTRRSTADGLLDHLLLLRLLTAHQAECQGYRPRHTGLHRAAAGCIEEEGLRARTRRSTASWNSAPLESTALPALGLGLGSVLGLGLG